jgi:hypothetical protein
MKKMMSSSRIRWARGSTELLRFEASFDTFKQKSLKPSKLNINLEKKIKKSSSMQQLDLPK